MCARCECLVLGCPFACWCVVNDLLSIDGGVTFRPLASPPFFFVSAPVSSTMTRPLTPRPSEPLFPPLSVCAAPRSTGDLLPPSTRPSGDVTVCVVFVCPPRSTRLSGEVVARPWLHGIGVFFNTRKGQFQYKISSYIIIYHVAIIIYHCVSSPVS